MRLPESQVAVLEAASATEERTIEQLSEATGLKPETVTGAAFDLEAAGLVTVAASETVSYAVTAEGETYADTGLPEVRLYRAARDAGADDAPVSMGEVIGAADLDGPEVDIASPTTPGKGTARWSRGGSVPIPGSTRTRITKRRRSRRWSPATRRATRTPSNNSNAAASSSDTSAPFAR